MKRNLCVLCLFVCITANAAVVWDGTSAPWTKGSGTKADPYLIETPSNLRYLEEQVDKGNTYTNTYFLQTEDLYLYRTTGAYIQIGRRGGRDFSGNYDGGNHQMLDLRYCPFGNIKSATIQNITIAGASMVALIECASGHTTVINCNNRSTSDVKYAGIVQTATDYIRIISCRNFAKITIPLVDNKYDGTHSNRRYVAGGIIAIADSIYVSGSRNKGTIALKLTTNYDDLVPIGGIIGYAYKYALAEKCSNQSSINGYHGIAGGIIGDNSEISYYRNGFYVNWCYNSGDIGGYGLAAKAKITNSYSTGKSGTDECKLQENSSVHNCYFTNNGNCVYYYNGRYYQKTATELKTQDFLSLLNADSAYFCKDYTNINQGYPTFKWVYGKFYNIYTLYKSEQGTVSGAGEYPQGAQVKLTATPKDNYTFVGWSDGNTNNPRTISVDTLDATYVAQFDRLSYTVYVNQDCSITVE